MHKNILEFAEFRLLKPWLIKEEIKFYDHREKEGDQYVYTFSDVTAWVPGSDVRFIGNVHMRVYIIKRDTDDFKITGVMFNTRRAWIFDLRNKNKTDLKLTAEQDLKLRQYLLEQFKKGNISANRPKRIDSVYAYISDDLYTDDLDAKFTKAPLAGAGAGEENVPDEYKFLTGEQEPQRETESEYYEPKPEPESIADVPGALEPTADELDSVPEPTQRATEEQPEETYEPPVDDESQFTDETDENTVKEPVAEPGYADLSAEVPEAEPSIPSVKPTTEVPSPVSEPEPRLPEPVSEPEPRLPEPEPEPEPEPIGISPPEQADTAAPDEISYDGPTVGFWDEPEEQEPAAGTDDAEGYIRDLGDVKDQAQLESIIKDVKEKEQYLTFYYMRKDGVTKQYTVMNPAIKLNKAGDKLVRATDVDTNVEKSFLVKGLVGLNTPEAIEYRNEKLGSQVAGTETEKPIGKKLDDVLSTGLATDEPTPASLRRQPEPEYEPDKVEPSAAQDVQDVLAGKPEEPTYAQEYEGPTEPESELAGAGDEQVVDQDYDDLDDEQVQKLETAKKNYKAPTEAVVPPGLDTETKDFLYNYSGEFSKLSVQAKSLFYKMMRDAEYDVNEDEYVIENDGFYDLSPVENLLREIYRFSTEINKPELLSLVSNNSGIESISVKLS